MTNLENITQGGGSLGYTVHPLPSRVRIALVGLYEKRIGEIAQNYGTHAQFSESPHLLAIAIESQFDTGRTIYDALYTKPDKSAEDLMALSHKTSLDGCLVDAKAYAQQAVGIDEMSEDTKLEAQYRKMIFENFELVFQVVRGQVKMKY